MGYVEGMCTVQCSGLYRAENHVAILEMHPTRARGRCCASVGLQAQRGRHRKHGARAARVVGGACTGYLDVLTGDGLLLRTFNRKP